MTCRNARMMPISEDADDQRVERRIGFEGDQDLRVDDDDDQAAQNQKDQHPHQKDAGRGNLEWIDVFRHALSQCLVATSRRIKFGGSSPKQPVPPLWHGLSECNSGYCRFNANARRNRPAHAPVPRPSHLTGGFQHSLQFALYCFVAGNDMSLGEHGVAAVDVGDEAAGFAHHDRCRRRCPRAKCCAPSSRRAGRPRQRRGRAPPRRTAAAPRPCPAPRRVRAVPDRGRRGRDAASRRRSRNRRGACAPATRSRLSLRNAPLPRSAMKSSSVIGL